MTIDEFAALVERQQVEQLHKDDLGCEANVHNHRTRVVPGWKYTKVDIGHSGKFMVVNETGEIFGIQGYGIIHRGHQYGTLETVGDYWWGNYQPVLIPQAVSE